MTNRETAATSTFALRPSYFATPILGQTAFKRAAIALGIPCRANLASVMYQPVRELDPLRRRDDLHEILFHFFWSLGSRQTQPMRQPENVRVHHNAGSNAISSP